MRHRKNHNSQIRRIIYNGSKTQREALKRTLSLSAVMFL